VVDPCVLKLSISTAIPIKQVYLESSKTSKTLFQDDSEGKKKINNDFGVAPMSLKKGEFHSKQTIKIRRGNESIEDKFHYEPVVQNVPKALWGESSKPNINEKDHMVRDTLTGFDITPKESILGATTQFPLSKLQAIPESKDTLNWESLSAESEQQLADVASREKIIASLHPGSGSFANLLEIVTTFGFDEQDININHLDLSTDTEFLSAPQLWNKNSSLEENN
jgi:hypothetical protein